MPGRNGWIRYPKLWRCGDKRWSIRSARKALAETPSTDDQTNQIAASITSRAPHLDAIQSRPGEARGCARRSTPQSSQTCARNQTTFTRSNHVSAPTDISEIHNGPFSFSYAERDMGEILKSVSLGQVWTLASADVVEIRTA
jgi:hypothetical protein